MKYLYEKRMTPSSIHMSSNIIRWMQNIEPIQFEAIGPGLDIKDEEYNKKVQMGYQDEWDETHDALLSQSIPDDLEEISPDRLSERMGEIMEDMFSPMDNVAPGLVEEPRRHVMFTSSFDRPRMTFWSKEDTVLVPNPSISGNVFIITNNKDVGRDVRDRFIDNIREKVEHLDLHGVEDIEISKGNDYAKQVITESSTVSAVSEGEPDEFEESVRDDLLPITESILCSCEINFGEHSPNPEYDILLPLAPNAIINVEVKDYSGRDERPAEDDIIDDPLNQARLLDINHIFSIAKEIDDELRQNFERSVELRDDIEIVHEDDVHEKVRQYIQDETLEDLVWSSS